MIHQKFIFASLPFSLPTSVVEFWGFSCPIDSKDFVIGQDHLAIKTVFLD